MQHLLDLATRHAIDATLTSAVTIDGGPTAEQLRLLDAVRDHVLELAERPAPLDPDAAGAAITEPQVRRVVSEALIVLELMRHPASAALAEQVDRYLVVLGGDGAEQALVRDTIADARDRVAEDWARTREPTNDEPLLQGADDAEVLTRLRALGECPPGSLGRAFSDFYARNGLSLPVGHLSLVSHDFAHVLAGYEPTPEGELALQAMLVASTRGTHHFSGLLASLLLYEVGLLPFPDIEPKVAVLDRPGAPELFADAIRRGAECPCDVQALDHLALASRDLVALRADLGVPAPPAGPFTFVV
jgi:hypothetical protein